VCLQPSFSSHIIYKKKIHVLLHESIHTYLNRITKVSDSVWIDSWHVWINSLFLISIMYESYHHMSLTYYELIHIRWTTSYMSVRADQSLLWMAHKIVGLDICQSGCFVNLVLSRLSPDIHVTMHLPDDLIGNQLPLCALSWSYAERLRLGPLAITCVEATHGYIR
jgi:hypothetical protein